jgi:hypothetical protein
MFLRSLARGARYDHDEFKQARAAKYFFEKPVAGFKKIA